MIGDFAKPNDIGAGCWRGAGRAGIIVPHNVGRIPTMIATGTERPVQRAMHVNDIRRSRHLVQAVDILCHQGHFVAARRLQTRQGVMGGVRGCLARVFATGVIKIMDQYGVSGEALGRCDLIQIIFGPKAVFVPKCPQPAFR